MNDREKKKSYCVKKSQFTDLLPTPDCALSLVEVDALAVYRMVQYFRIAIEAASKQIY